MNNLRQDLREVFDKQQEGLGAFSGTRERVLRSALENKNDEPIGRRTQLVAGIAAAVIAILAVGTFALVRNANWRQTLDHPVPAQSPARHGPPLVATPATNPFPGLFKWDIDLLDGATAWALLTNCNGATTDPCNYFVTATTDGGGTWSKPVPIPLSFDPQSGDAPRTIRFINSDDGFVYGGRGAFVTHNGGKTWANLDLHATFFSLISGRGRTVWAFTYPCAKGTLCSYDARSSSDGGRSWSAPYALPLGFSPFDVTFFGSSGLLISGSPTGRIEITSDGGKTWRSINSQCKDSHSFRAWVATSDGNELWELCMGLPKVPAEGASPDSADKVLYVSQDGGRSWSQKGTSQAGGKLPILGSQLSLVSTRPHELLLGTDKTPIMLTTDTALSWTKVQASPSGVQWIRFISPQIGWAMDVHGAIWSTADAGSSWMQLPGYYARF